MDEKNKKFREFEHSEALTQANRSYFIKLYEGFNKIPEKHPTFFYVPGKGFVKKDEKDDHLTKDQYEKADEERQNG